MDYLAKKGLMNKATARARKAAVNTVLSILDEEEAKDVTTIDVDHLFTRYANIAGANYKPESLNVYKGRLRAALDDFKNYLENPMTFRPSVQGGGRKASEKAKLTSELERPQRESASRITNMAPPPTSVSVLPIPIRTDLVVQIQGLPYDLTPQEANKIANVVKAMASTE
jgi:hypothetical protein